MFYLIPITILAYKHRMNIGYYLMKSYSYLEIVYNRWYNKYYLNPDYKLYINGNIVSNEEDIHQYTRNDNNNKDLLFEIEYLYKNKFYRIVGNNLEKLLDYLDKIDEYISLNTDSNRIYRWISAVDDDNNCYLELVKKYSGPLGDFYGHVSEIDIYHHNLEWLKDRKVIITNFRLDEYLLDGTCKYQKVKL